MNLKSSNNGGGVIRCIGPCRKRFRSDIVTTDRSVAHVLLASDPAETGLFWFCPACRSQVIVQPEDEREDTLPPELWLMIFEFLDGKAMLNARLTCHRWKAIVDGNSSLRNEFCVEFEELTMDREYKPENLPPTARASFSSVDILEVDSWWPTFGAGLTTLEVYDCEVALSTFLTMLKGTPNLDCLDLGRLRYTSVEVPAVDFRLERLTYLRCKDVFNFFGQIFPRLVQLNLGLEDYNEEVVCHLLQTCQSTLKYLTCRLTPYMLERIAGMNRLQLTFVELCKESVWAVQLSRTQRFIKDLNLTATIEELHEIGKNLSQLKEIHVSLKVEEQTLVPSFLVDMPLLTLLSLVANQKKLHFNEYKNLHLEYLRLYSVHIVMDSLKTYLLNSTNVQDLQLNTCTLPSWSDLFVVLVPSLHHLTLWKCVALRYATTTVPNPQQYNLNDLDIFDSDIPEQILVQLLLQCPRLEKLSFRRVNTVSDEVVAIVCQLPLLQELDIYCCPSVTDVAAGLVINNCAHLRSVSFTGCTLISQTIRKQLQQLSWTR